MIVQSCYGVQKMSVKIEYRGIILFQVTPDKIPK